MDVINDNAGGLDGLGQLRALLDAGIQPPIADTMGFAMVQVEPGLGFLPAPYMAIYSATKHALEGYSESLDHELRTSGIRVTLVEPAYTRTSFDQNMTGPDEERAEYNTIRAHMALLLTKVMETADEPEVVAEAIVRAATDTKPRLRYPAGPLARRLAVLRRFAPASLVDGSLRKQMRLDG